MICMCVCVYIQIYVYQFNSVQFICSVVSNSLQPHGVQHASLPCPSPIPGACSNSCPLTQWCHPTISSSVIPFSSCPQSFPASGFFQMSQLFTSGGQSTGVSASTSVLPMNTQDWSPLGWAGWISLKFKELSRVFSKLSRVFSNTTVQKHQFFDTQYSLVMMLMYCPACKIFSCSLQNVLGCFSWGMWDLFPWPEVKPKLPALGAGSRSHWTTREIPHPSFLKPVIFSLLFQDLNLEYHLAGQFWVYLLVMNHWPFNHIISGWGYFNQWQVCQTCQTTLCVTNCILSVCIWAF